ncbi:MAG: hypothetical protein ACRBN8_06020 [Nannocystales bacterium]
MRRTPAVLSICSLALLLTGSAHSAPATKKAAPTKHRKRRPSKGTAAIKKATAKGPAVTVRKGVVRMGLAPKEATFDNNFDAQFGSMRTTSNPAAGTIEKKMFDVAPLRLSRPSKLTPTRPSSRGFFFFGYKVQWQAGVASWREAQINVEGDGGVSIMMPLRPELVGHDLLVECSGEFTETMSVRGGVTYPGGFFTTSAASFSFVADTLRFMITVPSAEVENPAFGIALRSTSKENWTLTSCVVERL